MPLTNLLITSTVYEELTGDTVANADIRYDSYTNEQALPKCVKITIAPYPAGEVDQGGMLGYWSIRPFDITISNYHPYALTATSAGIVALPNGETEMLVRPTSQLNTEFSFTSSLSGNTGPTPVNQAGYRYSEFPWQSDNPRAYNPSNGANAFYSTYWRFNVNEMQEYVDVPNNTTTWNGVFDQLIEGPPNWSDLSGNTAGLPGFPFDIVQDIIMVDTVGKITGPQNAPAVQGNAVEVYIKLKDDVTIEQAGAVVHYIDFDGRPDFIEFNPGAVLMPPPPNIDLDILLSQEGDEVAISDTIEGSTVTETNIDTGFSNPTVRLNFDLPNLVNRASVKVGTISIKSKDDTYFSKAPKFNSEYGDNITTILKSKKKTSGKPTTYILDLMYNNIKGVPNEDTISGRIQYTTQEKKRKTILIDGIAFGSENVRPNGEERIIKINGTPGATIGLAVNESFQDDYSNVYTDIDTDYVINKHNDVSILDPAVTNGTVTDGYGKDMPILYRKIDPSGQISFRQKFPSTSVTTKLLTTGKTATNFDLNNRDDIKIGDRLYTKSLSNTTVVKVSDLPAAHANRVEFDTSITLPDNCNLTFKRNRCYNINVIPDKSSTLGYNVPTSDPTYFIKQYLNPIITLKHSMTGTDFTIGGESAGNDYDVKFEGVALKTGNTRQLVTFDLDLVSGVLRFDTVTKAKFSSTNKDNSDWTNSITLENGGTKVNISNFRTTTTLPSNVITITYQFEVTEWGDKDVTMELPINDFVTYS